MVGPDRQTQIQEFCEHLPKYLEHYRPFLSQRLLAYLAPFQAPPLPEHFIPRPEVTDALKVCLLNNEPTTPGVLVVSAIHGMAGVGKSTLAAALAHDQEVRDHFPDGILWTTLGQQPEILSKISGWIHAMRDNDFRPTTVEAASTHLNTLLQDKAILLVVDDIWNPEHAVHFKVGGLRCQVLITTRETIVARAVDADLYSVDVMNPEQALALLSSRLRRTFHKREEGQARVLAKEVGYLPLALELPVAQVAGGVSWEELINELQTEIVRLESLETLDVGEISDEELLKRFSLCASLNLSLRRLSEEHLSCLMWLGILPEDVIINSVMTATLWEMTAHHAQDTLRYLYNKALLMSGPPVIVGDIELPAYRVHDLVHDMARNLLTTPQPQGLGLSVQDAHTTLLERYKQHTQNGFWHTLPDDGYIHAHLTWHFQKVGQAEPIHALLREETEEGRNGWYQAREQLGQTAGFLEDVNRAWKLAEHDRNIGLQCRYALIITSLNSLAKSIPPALVGTLVEKGVWSPAQGLAHAYQVPNPKQRTEMLVELVNNLPEPLRKHALQEALAAARMITNAEKRTNALIEVALHLSENLRTSVLREALTATQLIESLNRRTKALTKLVPYLTESLKEQAIQEVLAVTQAFSDGEERSKALVQLAPHLPESLLQEVVTAVLAVKTVEVRVKALVELAPHLSGSLRESVLRETLAAARDLHLFEDGIGGKAEALVELATHLSEPMRESALQEALIEVITITQAIELSEDRVRVWMGLMPLLPESLREERLQEVLRVARTITDAGYRAEILVDLVPLLPESLREEGLQEVLTATRTIWLGSRAKAKALTGLVSYFSESLLQEALAVARTITDDAEARIKTLATHLPESLRAYAAGGVDGRTGDCKCLCSSQSVTGTGILPIGFPTSACTTGSIDSSSGNFGCGSSNQDADGDSASLVETVVTEGSGNVDNGGCRGSGQSTGGDGAFLPKPHATGCSGYDTGD